MTVDILKKYHIEINGVMVSAFEILNVVARFCGPIILNNQDHAHPISFSGSSVGLIYQGSCFQLCTGHQFANVGRDRSDARLVKKTTPVTMVGPRVVSQPKVPNERANGELLEDLCAVTYSNEAAANGHQEFLQVSEEFFTGSRPRSAKKILAYFFVGFPTDAQTYELDNDYALEHFHGHWIRLLLSPANEVDDPIPHRDHFVAHGGNGLDHAFSGIDPDGISGAPVFVVYLDEDDTTQLGFCGIITHAAKDGRCAVLPADIILKFLDLIA